MFFAAGASQMRDLSQELGIQNHHILPGAVLVRDTPKNICRTIETKTIEEKNLLILIGSNDIIDKRSKTMRPQFVRRHLLRKIQQLLRLRKDFQPDGKLVWILLPPRHIIENPHLQTQLKEMNDIIKNMITDIRSEVRGHKRNFVSWVDTKTLCNPLLFRFDGVHLNSLGLTRLAALTRAQMTNPNLQDQQN